MIPPLLGAKLLVILERGKTRMVVDGTKPASLRDLSRGSWSNCLEKQDFQSIIQNDYKQTGKIEENDRNDQNGKNDQIVKNDQADYSDQIPR